MKKSDMNKELEREMTNEAVAERYGLAVERIGELAENCGLSEPFDRYFQSTAAFLKLVAEEYTFVESGALRQADLATLKEHNRALYADILPDHYGESFGNPVYAGKQLGAEWGQLLGALYGEFRATIPYAYEQKKFELTIRMELFLEVYAAFSCACLEEKSIPKWESIRQILYWYISDYSEVEVYQRRKEQVDPSCDFVTRMITESDWQDVRYLYYYGEYVTEEEVRTAQYLAKLPEEVLAKMADTYTEGYRIGFGATGKDISKKKTVEIRYCLGFERMIRRAIEQFRKMGLEPTFCRAVGTLFQKRSGGRNGWYGAIPNKQYDFDHREDDALFLDKGLVNRRLEVMQTAFEAMRNEALLFGGPAVVETFGEVPFAPVITKEACAYSEAQQKLSVEYAAQAGQLVNRYIPGEERSFTIIAFPMPAIGAQYEAIFDEIVRINTLDYVLYQTIQQKLIDALNEGCAAQIKGTNGNQTDLTVQFFERTKPQEQTIFENCVADVNIPVGEVFTSPKLEGTEGVLHVSHVFLDGLEYQNLKLTFQNGMVKEYSCTNFETLKENQKYIRDNVLFHHESLPMGEFAIGTNTTAYVAAQKYDMADKLPILIAEKMGPHFAVGDTCYSHEEENRLYNPDGKEIVAKENSISALRNTEPGKAYFQCHTDITIPYDELGELAVLKEDGTRTILIQDGRFVLAGCEELNRPFQNEIG